MKAKKQSVYGNGHALTTRNIESKHEGILPELDKLSLRLAELAQILQDKDTSDVVTNLKNGALKRIKEAQERFNGEVHEPDSNSERGCKCRRAANKR